MGMERGLGLDSVILMGKATGKDWDLATGKAKGLGMVMVKEKVMDLVMGKVRQRSFGLLQFARWRMFFPRGS